MLFLQLRLCILCGVNFSLCYLRISLEHLESMIAMQKICYTITSISRFVIFSSGLLRYGVNGKFCFVFLKRGCFQVTTVDQVLRKGGPLNEHQFLFK